MIERLTILGGSSVYIPELILSVVSRKSFEGTPLGIYLSGDVGMRTEIDVYMGADGPEVTTPDPQDAVWALWGGET